VITSAIPYTLNDLDAARNAHGEYVIPPLASAAHPAPFLRHVCTSPFRRYS